MTLALAKNKINPPKLNASRAGGENELGAGTLVEQVMKMSQSPPPIQRKCEDCKEEELQMKPLAKTITPIIQKQSEEEVLQMKGLENDSATHSNLKSSIQQSNEGTSLSLSKITSPLIQRQEAEATPVVQNVSTICSRNRMDGAEEIEREQIYQDFIRELPSMHASVRVAIIAAMCHYSLIQLRLMAEAGVRVWLRGSYPPAFEGLVESEGGGSAAYTLQIRTLFFGRNVNSGFVTHELAHAWDHVRNMRNRRRVRMDNLREQRKRNLRDNPGSLLSETRIRQDVVLGGSRSRRGRISYDTMYQNYRTRLPHNRFAFAHSARRSYSLSSVREFYAEGYSVYSGNSVLEQARLYKYANELFNVLHNEAQAQNMPLPNMEEVRREASHLPDARSIQR